MTSWSGDASPNLGVERRTISRFAYSRPKKNAPNATPSAILVRRIVQKTEERCTSRNHRRSTKKPERMESRTRIRTIPATTSSGQRRRLRAGASRTDTLSSTSAQCPVDEKCPTDASGAPGRARGRSVSPPAHQEVHGVLEGGHRPQPDAGVRRPGFGEVLPGHEEHVRSGPFRGDELLRDPA